MALLLLGLYLPLWVVAWSGYANRGDDGTNSEFKHGALTVILVDPDSPGARAGIQPGDRILAVDGMEARNTDRFWQVYAPGPDGTAERLMIQHLLPGTSGASFGPPTEVALLRQAFASRPEYLFRILAFTLTGVANLVVATAVLLARPGYAPARIAFAFGCAVGYAVLIPALSDLVYQPWLYRSLFLVGTVAGSALLHLFVTFPAAQPLLARLRTLGPAVAQRFGGATLLLYVLPLAVSALLSLDTNSPAIYYSYFLDAALVGAALLALAWSYRHPPTPLTRAQVKWILWALAVGVIGWVGGAVIPQVTAAGISAISLAAGLSAWTLLPIAIGFAVLRYRLFDVDRVLQGTILYVSLTALLVLGYVALSFFAAQAAALITGAPTTSRTVQVLIALVVAAAAHPARLKLQALLDQTIYRDRLRRQHFLDEATEQLGHARSPVAVAAFLTDHTARRLALTGAWVVLSPATRNRPSPGTDRSPTSVDPLFSLLASATRPVLLLDEPTSMGSSPLPVMPAVHPDLTRWHDSGARLLVPLRAGLDQPGGASNSTAPAGDTDDTDPHVAKRPLLGIWAVGARRSGDLFDRADLAAFTRVGQQASVLLDYDRLHQDQVEHELTRRELARAHELQQRLLPAALPGWAGLLDIAARFRPAEEMSGDFYDAVALSATIGVSGLPPLQVTVGDVAGKGMPAALVMAQAQTALRTRARQSVPVAAGGASPNDAPNPSLSPAHTLRLAGRLLHAGAGREHFVACALAVVEPRAGGALLRLANAGQAPPLLCRDKLATELEPDGDHLPLGVVPDIAYSDLEIDLRAGDVVVLATNGLAGAPARQVPARSLPGSVQPVNTALSVDAGPPADRADPVPQSRPGEVFGFGRLATSAAHWAACACGAEEVVTGIWEDVRAWSGDTPPHDDMTLIVLCVLSGNDRARAVEASTGRDEHAHSCTACALPASHAEDSSHE